MSEKPVIHMPKKLRKDRAIFNVSTKDFEKVIKNPKFNKTVMQNMLRAAKTIIDGTKDLYIEN